MLLAIDIGNTNIVVGLYQLRANGGGVGGSPPPGDLAAHWRLDTRQTRTGDEYAALLAPLFQMAGFTFGSVSAIMVATVVPPVQFAIEQFCQDHLGRAPLWVGPGIKTGISILCD